MVLKIEDVTKENPQNIWVCSSYKGELKSCTCKHQFLDYGCEIFIRHREYKKEKCQRCIDAVEEIGFSKISNLSNEI